MESTTEAAEPSATPDEAKIDAEEDAEEAAVVEEESEDKPTEEAKPPKTKTVEVEEWIQTNPQAPIW